MDRGEFSRYATAYQDTVYRVALNYLGSPADAEDVMQEVLLRLYTSGRHFNDESHVKHWLIRVTLNLCSNAVRARRHYDSRPPEELPCAVPFQTEEQLALYQAVMALPEAYRTVLYLFYYEDYSVREIARILRLKDSAVTTRLSRAREKLRASLTKEDAYGL